MLDLKDQPPRASVDLLQQQERLSQEIRQLRKSRYVPKCRLKWILATYRGFSLEDGMGLQQLGARCGKILEAFEAALRDTDKRGEMFRCSTILWRNQASMDLQAMMNEMMGWRRG